MEKKEKETETIIENKISNEIEVEEYFDFKINNQEIFKNSFITNYQNSVNNISGIRTDNQGFFWNNQNSRNNCFLSNISNNEAFRCEEISEDEIELKNTYKAIKKYDEIYQFKKYIKVRKNHICHF